MKFLLFMILFFCAEAFALSEVGLSPTTRSLSRSEVMTATTPPADALFYNPAHLAWKGVAIEFIGAGYAVDENNQKRGNDIVRGKKIDSKQFMADALESGKPTYMKNDVEFLNLIFPYFAIKSFANARLYSHKVNEETPHQDIDFLARFGITSGLAFSFHHWAIGYSYYLIKQADFFASPNDTQISAITTAAQNGTLSSTTTDFANFTRMDYGEATGHNFGLSYREAKNNSSGFGLAVLNAGGTRFTTDRPIIRGKFQQIEQAARDEATEHDITLGRPKEIKQMVNAGINFATDEGKENYFFASFAMDYQDIGGSTLDHHVAMAADIGFRVDDTLSLLTSIPVAKHHGVVYFMGLTGLDLIGGYRVDESMSAGVDLKLHVGFNKLISLVRINVNAMMVKSLHQQVIPNTTGARIGVGLTFVFPDIK